MFFCIKQISRQITQAKLKQYYTILGVTPKSTEQDIKKQFRKLAKEYHPDTGNQKSEHKFKEVLEAYKYLSDPKNPKTLTESSFSSGPSTHSQQQYEQQHQYKHETRQQRIRKQTYEYFNSRRRHHQASSTEDEKVEWTSFRGTLRGNPELIVATLFMALLLMTSLYTARSSKRVYSVPERIFETQEDAIEYYRNQEIKNKGFSQRFNIKKRFGSSQVD